MRLSVVAALALAGAVVAGCAPTLSPSPSVTASPSVASSGSAAASCTTADVQATGGPWGGAAGSRGADVTVVAKGPSCLLPPRPVVAILDATGAVVLQAKPVVAASQPPLAAGGAASFSILFSNWCDPAPKLPLRPVLVLGSAEIEIVGLSLATVDDLPPCNGPGQPASLSATDWQLR